MNLTADDIVIERPVASTALVAAIATAAYVGIQLALDGTVATAETASFVVVFTLVYVAGNRFLHRRAADDDAGDSTADGAPSEE